jgi:hypothetical protein
VRPCGGAAFGAPFGALTAEGEIEWGPRTGDDAFAVQATFPRGTGDKEMALRTQTVHFQLGTFAVTLPPGSLTRDQPGRFKFDGVLDGVALEVVIRPLGGSFEFQVNGKGADLSGTVNPVPVHCIIGEDSGSTTIIAGIK